MISPLFLHSLELVLWESACNELTSGGLDYIAGTLTFKAAIQIKKISEEEFLKVRELKRVKFHSYKVIYDDLHAHTGILQNAIEGKF